MLEWQRVGLGIERDLVPVVGKLRREIEPRLTLVARPGVGVAAEVLVIVAALEILVGANHVVHVLAHVGLDDRSRDLRMVRHAHRLADVVQQGGEHHLFVGPHYLITVHHEPSTQLKDLQERIHKSPELTHGKPAFLTYLAIDALVDATFPVLDNLDEEVDKLEDEITEKATQESLSRIYHLKHAVSQLRRFLGTQRDVFQSLITHGIHLQQQDMTLYYRDVYDHIVRQYETADSLRDLLTSAMGVYLSTVSNRLNQTTKALTVIASLFLPLSFLTGFYGMNFAYLVGVLETPTNAFVVGLVTMLVAIGIQLYLFRRRGWI